MLQVGPLLLVDLLESAAGRYNSQLVAENFGGELMKDDDEIWCQEDATS